MSYYFLSVDEELKGEEVPVMTAQHVFVKHTVTPVAILQDDEGEPVVFIDPDQVPVAEESSVFGCQVCGMGVREALESECPGFDPDDQ